MMNPKNRISIARRGLILMPFVLVSLLLISGCNTASSTPTPPANVNNTTPEPQTIIETASTATADVQSYRYSGSSTSIGSNGLDSQQDIIAEFASPDRYHIQETEDNQTSEFIIIGDKYYLGSGHLSGPIAGYPQGLSSFYTKETALRYLDSLTDIQQLPDEKLADTECFHYQGNWDVEKQIAKTKTTMEEYYATQNVTPSPGEIDQQLAPMRLMKLCIELWIGQSDYLIRQMKLDEQIPDNPEGTEFNNVSALMKYSDFNQPVDINPPLDASGELLPGWQLPGSITPDSKLQVFSTYVTCSIGGQPGYNDPAHQQISYQIRIANQSSETVKNVQVTLSTPASNDLTKPLVIQGEPETPGHLDFAPGDNETYNIVWNYDGSHSTKTEIIRLVEQTTAQVKFTAQDGRELTQSLLSNNNPPYPTAIPASPPAE